MEKEELYLLTKQLILELKEIGIPVSKNIEKVSINTRAKSRFGACKVRKNTLGERNYTIEISSEILSCEIKDISSIIIHELLHTCKGCFNHGKKWKIYSALVKEKLGYNISRTQSYESLGLNKPDEKEGIKYVVKCSGCGAEFPRKRLCNLVKNPHNYRCSKCGNILYLQGENNHI